MRGQSKEAWLARWRDGTCPAHGGGFVDDPALLSPSDPGRNEAYVAVRCSVAECEVRAARWPGEDEHHASFGWRAGPEPIHAALVHAKDVDAESAKPGLRARVVRTSYSLE